MCHIILTENFLLNPDANQIPVPKFRLKSHGMNEMVRLG